MDIAKKADSTFSPILADKIGGGPKCKGEAPSLAYGKGCLKVFRVKVRELDFVAVEFDNAKNAKRESSRLNQPYYKNWLFDEVQGEPPLEDFIKKAFFKSP